MKSRIYIARVFDNLDPSKGWVDNDPHFWSSPPTWGICRPDFRKTLNEDDYVFFVSSQNNPNFPQMVFAYIKIKEKISHVDAFKRFPQKRMRANAVINGNILVNSRGDYSKGDQGIHADRYDRIKKQYVVGYEQESRMLTIDEINRKQGTFLQTLNSVFGLAANSIYSILNEKGRKMDDQQTNHLLNWLNT